ncbi:hypothetical protein RIF29_36314 [Crotalaria pallida]|uniref:Uncharacterized protein n=1 Tax=Crotalaria pallida TaxID=3830 RepID=A0AAN9EAZ2_CROPI
MLSSSSDPAAKIVHGDGDTSSDDEEIRFNFPYDHVLRQRPVFDDSDSDDDGKVLVLNPDDEAHINKLLEKGRIQIEQILREVWCEEKAMEFREFALAMERDEAAKELPTPSPTPSPSPSHVCIDGTKGCKEEAQNPQACKDKARGDRCLVFSARKIDEFRSGGGGGDKKKYTF